MKEYYIDMNTYGERLPLIVEGLEYADCLELMNDVHDFMFMCEAESHEDALQEYWREMWFKELEANHP